MGLRGEDRTERQPVAAQLEQVVEPVLQVWQPVDGRGLRHGCLLRRGEAERVDVPPDDRGGPVPQGCRQPAIFFDRFSSSAARKSSVLRNGWSRETSRARSLVIWPPSTVSTQTCSSF